MSRTPEEGPTLDMNTAPLTRVSEVWNVPNLITSARIVLSIIMFFSLSFGWYEAALLLFLTASLTDKLDGWYARRFQLVTQLGRILDPLADKIIICGLYIYLVAIPRLTEVDWGLRAWMVVAIVLREMVVTVLRSMIEERGGDFSAKWSGKIKMVFQCVAAALCLLWLLLIERSTAPHAMLPWVQWSMVVSLWIAVASTLYSGFIYVVAAGKAFRGASARTER